MKNVILIDFLVEVERRRFSQFNLSRQPQLYVGEVVVYINNQDIAFVTTRVIGTGMINLLKLLVVVPQIKPIVRGGP